MRIDQDFIMGGQYPGSRSRATSSCISLSMLEVFLVVILLCPAKCKEGLDQGSIDLNLDVDDKDAGEFHIVGGNTGSESVSNKLPEPTHRPSSAEKYKLRFSQYRDLQAQAMQSVFKKVEQKNLNGLLSTMLTNLFKIMLEARVNLTKVGYVAGDEFPEDIETKESLSKVLENTFMFSDLLLQRPKAVHAVYDKHQDWQDSLNWAYHICSKSDVFSTEEQDYLNLMAKESDILPKDANYQNPYVDESEKPRKKFEDPKPAKKKNPKKPKRGPRLSHTEL